MSRPRAPHMLPPGRHGLPREFVEANQRGRLIAAMTTVCVDLGYASTSLEDVVRASGVSRRQLYDYYPLGKPELFLAALDVGAERLLDVVRVVRAQTPTRRARARAGIKALLALAAVEPATAGLVVEALAADDQARARREKLVADLGVLLTDDRSATATVWAGGVFELVQSYVRAGRHTDLPDLLPDVLAALKLAPVGT